jgi:putative phosphoribosyl transferase
VVNGDLRYPVYRTSGLQLRASHIDKGWWESRREMLFENRRDAGRQLASALAKLSDLQAAVVLGLPRGGVPVAFEVAHAFRWPLDIFVVRKIGVPGQRELAMGAIASGGVVVVNQDIMQALKISGDDVRRVIEREILELERQECAYRDGRPPVEVAGRTAILIDDGIATGATMKAAARAVSKLASRVVIAAPVASVRTCQELEQEADQVICPHRPLDFEAVGMFYRDFGATSDGEVRMLLAQARREREIEWAGRSLRT